MADPNLYSVKGKKHIAYLSGTVTVKLWKHKDEEETTVKEFKKVVGETDE